jgi:hypothetical protein
MLKHTDTPVGTFLKRNTLIDTNAIYSGDMYYAENIVEEILGTDPNGIVHSAYKVTEAFYQTSIEKGLDGSTQRTLYWWCDHPALVGWVVAEGDISKAFWYTTYNVLTHQEAVCKYDEDDDYSSSSSYGYRNYSYSNHNDDYNMDDVKKVIASYKNKALEESILDTLKTSVSYNKISKESYERILKDILSPDTAKYFIDAMKPKT